MLICRVWQPACRPACIVTEIHIQHRNHNNLHCIEPSYAASKWIQNGPKEIFPTAYQTINVGSETFNWSCELFYFVGGDDDSPGGSRVTKSFVIISHDMICIPTLTCRNSATSLQVLGDTHPLNRLIAHVLFIYVGKNIRIIQRNLYRIRNLT